jgi:hypothetical protein
LCNKSYSRHPEYEAHIGSYDHQHRKRLQELKQLSRDPNAAERARRAERKADAEAGLRVLDTPGMTATATTKTTIGSGGSGGGGGGGGGFKKGGFKSSFTVVKGPGADSTSSASATTGAARINVLGDDDDDDDDDDMLSILGRKKSSKDQAASKQNHETNKKGKLTDAESDTDADYDSTGEGCYYDPRRPTECAAECGGWTDLATS